MRQDGQEAVGLGVEGVVQVDDQLGLAARPVGVGSHVARQPKDGALQLPRPQQGVPAHVVSRRPLGRAAQQLGGLAHQGVLLARVELHRHPPVYLDAHAPELVGGLGDVTPGHSEPQGHAVGSEVDGPTVQLAGLGHRLGSGGLARGRGHGGGGQEQQRPGHDPGQQRRMSRSSTKRGHTVVVCRIHSVQDHWGNLIQAFEIRRTGRREGQRRV